MIGTGSPFAWRISDALHLLGPQRPHAEDDDLILTTQSIVADNVALVKSLPLLSYRQLLVIVFLAVFA